MAAEAPEAATEPPPPVEEDGESEEETESERAARKKAKQDRKDKKEKKDKKLKKDDGEDHDGEQKTENKKGKRGSGRGDPGKTEQEQLLLDVYGTMSDEEWEGFDTPEDCPTTKKLKDILTSRPVTDPKPFEQGDRMYRWTKLGEKGQQQYLLGPLYILSMGLDGPTTGDYGETYFYAALPKSQFTMLDHVITMKLHDAERKMNARGHTPLGRKELSLKLPALEAFRMGMLNEKGKKDMMDMVDCTLVQFAMNIQDKDTFSVTCGDTAILLSEVFDKAPGAIGYASISIGFSCEVLQYGEIEDSDDDGKDRKKDGKKSKKKSHLKPVDVKNPRSVAGKASVKIKTTSLAIVAPTVLKALPMSESRKVSSVKTSKTASKFFIGEAR